MNINAGLAMTMADLVKETMKQTEITRQFLALLDVLRRVPLVKVRTLLYVLSYNACELLNQSWVKSRHSQYLPEVGC